MLKSPTLCSINRCNARSATGRIPALRFNVSRIAAAKRQSPYKRATKLNFPFATTASGQRVNEKRD
jgi:hypothetical protein